MKNEKDNLLISIVIPIYNSVEFLKRSIESILNQTYKNIEIILINDGSTDGSLEICQEYMNKDSRIIVINQENKGVSYTRNIGIEKSKGKFIMFVDADDYIEINMIEDMVNAITDEKIDLIISGIRMNFVKNGDIIKQLEYKMKDKIYTIKELINSILSDFDLICICGPCCKLYKTEILKNNNIRFTNELTMGEDTWYNLDYIDSCKGKVATISKIYYNYMRENPNSLFTKYYNNYILINEKIYNKFLNLLYKKADNETIKRYKKVYIFNLIYANAINFKYKTSIKKKIGDLKYSLNNKVIRENIKSIKVKGLKEKIFKFLIKYKLKYILFIYFKFKSK